MKLLQPVVLAALLLGTASAAATAASVANPVATFSGLDKITGRITNFDVYIGETVQFGALQITPRACYTRPPTETQRTSVFVEVDQVSLQQTVRRIFTGWMFADSPALNSIDHAVYDIWLTECKQQSAVPPPDKRDLPPGTQQAAQPAPAPPPPDTTETGSVPEDDMVAPEEETVAPEDSIEDTPPIPDTPANTPSFETLPPMTEPDAEQPVQ